MNHTITKLIAVTFALAFSAAATAVPIDLDNQGNNCSLGAVSGATACWGIFAGNDPGPSGDGYEMGGMQFDFKAKQDIGGALTDTPGTGLAVTLNGGQMGTWMLNANLFEAFLVVLKAGNQHVVWLLPGTASAGNWSTVVLEKNLSHLSIYGKGTGTPGCQINCDPPVTTVPEPGTIGLLGLGLLGVGLSRRRKKT